MTPNQLAILRADVLANADTLAAYNVGDRVLLETLYNADAVPAVKAWDAQTPVDRIIDAIDVTKYTPTDAPSETLLYLSRAANINIKQMNLQTMLIRTETLDSTKPTLRNGLKDATTSVPAGANGASIHPGGGSGATVLTACLRPAACSRYEKLFSAGPQTTGTVTGEVLTLSGPVGNLIFAEI